MIVGYVFHGHVSLHLHDDPIDPGMHAAGRTQRHKVLPPAGLTQASKYAGEAK